MPTYLERYEAGEHEAVWRELRALGAAVYDEPVHTDALAVARETMRRVRANIEILRTRLSALGFTFTAHPTEPDADGEPPQLAMPSTETPRLIAALEGEFGRLPLSLRAFYEIVGAVNLNGEPPSSDDPERPAYARDVDPDWSVAIDADVLAIYGIEFAWRFWRDVAEIPEERAEYQPPLFSDSTVGYISVESPETGADGLLMFEGGHMFHPNGSGELFPFVEYLRWSIAHGGFPGLTEPDGQLVVRHVPALVADLLPF